jgi:hypothetical protein
MLYSTTTPAGYLQADLFEQWTAYWQEVDFQDFTPVSVDGISAAGGGTYPMVAQKVARPRPIGTVGTLLAVGVVQYQPSNSQTGFSFLVGLTQKPGETAFVWRTLTLLPEPAWSCGSFDGGRILIAGQSGSVYEYVPGQGTLRNIPVGPKTVRLYSNGSVNLFAFDPDGGTYALFNGIHTNGASFGIVLAEFAYAGFADISSAQLGTPLMFALAVDPLDGRVFAASDSSVFTFKPEERKWYAAGSGLPANPHASNLSVVPDANGTMVAYLSTWGRSVWRAVVGRW